MYRGAYLNPSNIAFQNVLNDSIYVDKTDLIKFCNERVCTSNKLICCTRPRRFGKSIAIEMLAAYYSKGCDSKELFEGLNVSKYNMESELEVKLSKKFTEYMNSFDVIFLDIQSVLTKVSDSSKAPDFLTKRIKEELAEVYPECVYEDYDLASTLMEINAKENKQFIILIDEWDAIFRFDKYNEEAQRKYMLFLRSIFKGREADSYVAFAYITGILPIKKYNDESSLNNFNEYTVVSPAKMTEYIGFTENEVRELCTEYNMSFDLMQEFYGGYILNKQNIYCPYAVCTAIDRGQIKDYWGLTESYEALQAYLSLNFKDFEFDSIALLADCKLKIDMGKFANDLISFNSKEEVLECLVHLGYLTYDSEIDKVFIPNRDTNKVFERAIFRMAAVQRNRILQSKR